MLRIALIFALGTAFIYLALCAAVLVFQRSMIYFPQIVPPAPRANTIALSMDGAEVLVSTRAHSGKKALLYFGGNAEDVAFSLPELAAAFPEHALYLMHYRGYGGSTGKPTEAALVADALALYEHVHAAHSQIEVVGRSLGSGVAVQLAARRPVARVVLVTPFNSIVDIAAGAFPYLPMRWLMLDRYESWKYAGQITAPTLLIAAQQDEIIPRASTEALLGHFREGVASLHVITGTGHNTISNSPEYLALLRGR